MPRSNPRLKFLQNIEACLFDNESDIQIRNSRDEIAASCATIEDDCNQVVREQLAQFLSKLCERFFSLGIKHT